MDQPIAIAEGGLQPFVQNFDLSNIRGVESDPSDDEDKAKVASLSHFDNRSRESSPLSDTSSLTDVSEVGRQIEDSQALADSSIPDPSGLFTKKVIPPPTPSSARKLAQTIGSSAPPELPQSSMALVSIERLQQLAAVQRLMEVKGEAAMLKFLLEPSEPSVRAATEGTQQPKQASQSEQQSRAQYQSLPPSQPQSQSHTSNGWAVPIRAQDGSSLEPLPPS